ncbi:MAG TPA: hypothetical protein VIQ23_13370 [Hanamia sp.]
MANVIPASVQLFLFADQVVPADSALSAGTTIPFRNKKVKTNDLAVYLCAFAIFNLMENQIIHAEVKKKKILFLIPSTDVMLHQLSNESINGNLENLLKNEIAPEPVALKKIINKALQQDSPWPHKTIIYEVVKDSCQLGFGAQTQAVGGVKGLLKSFTGNLDFTPDIQKIEPEEVHFKTLLSKWEHFKNTNRELYDELLADCKAGINSRTQQND